MKKTWYETTAEAAIARNACTIYNAFGGANFEDIGFLTLPKISRSTAEFAVYFSRLPNLPTLSPYQKFLKACVLQLAAIAGIRVVGQQH